MRILVVDDEPLIAHTVSLIFRKQGFDVDTVHSASDALAAARRLTPDLLLCDIAMPCRDGIALLQDFGRELPACPILVLTGHYPALAEVADCARSLRQPVRILTKPCPPTDLLQAAGTLLTPA